MLSHQEDYDPAKLHSTKEINKGGEELEHTEKEEDFKRVDYFKGFNFRENTLLISHPYKYRKNLGS